MQAGIRIVHGHAELPGDLVVPDAARAIVVFAHGSGSSRMSARNRYVAEVLRSSGTFGTLLFDLLTPAEDTVRDNRFDIPLLAERLQAATVQLTARSDLEGLPIGFFGASTGAAAAIVAAVGLDCEVGAIVSRGGRPDLAGGALDVLGVPTLLIVGGDDTAVIGLNRQALARIPAADKRLQIVPGATHLFEEQGALEAAAGLALSWFERHLA